MQDAEGRNLEPRLGILRRFRTYPGLPRNCMGPARRSRFLPHRFLRTATEERPNAVLYDDRPTGGSGLMEDENDIAGRIGRLHDDATRSTPAFQSVLGAVLRTLDDVQRAESAAAASANIARHFGIDANAL